MFSVLNEIENMFSVFLLSFSINLPAFYHECHPLIGYATHVLFCSTIDSEKRSSVHWGPLFRAFKVSVKRI